MHQSGTIFTGKDSIKSFQAFIDQVSGRYSGVFILTDSNSRHHCLPVLMSRFQVPEAAVILEIEQGEINKNLETCMRIWHELALLGADRYSLLICLGGGVVCDLGGFVASTYQRGIDFVYIPTSLLAQVDAAIGGKTGVNLNKLKNYIGLFSPPNAVFIFTEFLRTLPEDELLSGYAEIIKHALLSSQKTYLQLVEKFPDKQSVRTNADWSAIVEHSVKIKNNVVNSDPFEKGLRKVLNFGHTVGHAFESHSIGNIEQPLLHGNAVALGMVVELQLSAMYCEFPVKLATEISEYILSVFPHYSFNHEDISDLTGFMGFDKKNKAGKIQMTLMRQPGDLLVDVACTKADIEKCLIDYIETINKF